MSSFSFKITKNDISPTLSRMASAAKRPEPVYRAMGTTFMSLTMGNFKSADYRPSAWPNKRDGSAATLQKSGTLSRSFDLAVTNTFAKVSATPIYAAIQQLGGIIRGHPWLRFKWGPGDKDWCTVAEVKIPARPFFPVENDKLTSRAEEKIAAAGMRAIERQINAG